jgi:NAD(P)-dependent dehydrogenase (short-subunit alcohol dehydrogenase family)
MDRKVVVITGAASGIGNALAKACALQEMKIVLADNDVTALCDTVEQLTAIEADVLGVVCDVSKLDSMRHLARQTLDRFGRVDWLFNNAGIFGHTGPVWELSIEHIRTVMDINLYGVLNGIQVFVPIMERQNTPCHIINSASILGLFSTSNLSPYIMSKHAIVSLSESLYFDLKNKGKKIDVSVSCPAFTDTQLVNNSTPLHEDDLHKTIAALIAKGSAATDIAGKIIEGVIAKQFYILTDCEAKQFCQTRIDAIINQDNPQINRLETKLSTLYEQSSPTS